MKRQYREFFKNYVQGILTGILLTVCVVLMLRIAGIHLLPSASLSDGVWEQARVVEQYIDRYYWKADFSDSDLADAAMKGLVYGLGDKYSAYYTEEEYKKVMSSVDGSYVGIGISMKKSETTNRIVVVDVKEGTPAAKAGLKANDEIQSINGTDVTALSTSEVKSMIGGEVGKAYALTVYRKENDVEKTLEVKVVNGNIVNQSVTYKMYPGDIGYIGIHDFDNNTANQFEEALNKLEEKNQKAMILDVRDNPGGTLDAAVKILDDLLPAGELIREKRRNSEDVVYKSTDEKHFDKPVAVLVNEGSASASEVLAGTLQDRGAASLVGKKSFGKGIVQTIFSLQKSCGGGIRLTTAEYLLPSGRSIHEKGLTPDVECEYTGTTQEKGAEDDNQLEKAVEVLKAKGGS